MSAYAIELKVIATVVVLIVMGALIWRHGYQRGVEDKVAFYEPILRQAADDKIAADQRAAATERRANEITSQVEQSHDQVEKALTDRAVLAEQRIADFLRQRASAAAHGYVEVSSVSGSPPERADPAASDERDQRLAERVSDVARQCEHDASELAEWQAWYDRQRSSLTSVTSE